MNTRMSRALAPVLLILFVSSVRAVAHDTNAAADTQRFVQLAAKNKEERSKIADLGVSIEFIRSDSVWGFATTSIIKDLEREGIKLLNNQDASVARGGHEGTLDFPVADGRFHNYAETLSSLKLLQSRNADIAKTITIGQSLEGREIVALQINTTPEDLMAGKSQKPGIVFMGNHHAREHLSLEVPLMMAEYLLEHREEPEIARLLATRDIWFIPMVNPDGAEFDINDGRRDYLSWRKNRRKNSDGSMGVDLNRNYGYKWGTGGSSKVGSSDTYMGAAPFSEPETQTIKAFVEERSNFKILLSYHTFSELILYPWGNTYDDIGNAKDLATFKAMARTMAAWTQYTPQQASDLYIASGDTTDWAYGERGIFAFTFELSPKSLTGGGFYPGAKVIDKVFADNVKPALYLIDLADDPYRATAGSPSTFLKNYVAPELPQALFWERDPMRWSQLSPL